MLPELHTWLSFRQHETEKIRPILCQGKEAKQNCHVPARGDTVCGRLLYLEHDHRTQVHSMRAAAANDDTVLLNEAKAAGHTKNAVGVQIWGQRTNANYNMPASSAKIAKQTSTTV